MDDTLTAEYQTILNCAAVLRSSSDRAVIWTKYADMHQSIERLTLDQGKTCGGYESHTQSPSQQQLLRPRPPPPGPRVIAIRTRWVGKSGRVRREGMGKRVNFCARSVVTCDSFLEADQIAVPLAVVSRLTQPVVVHAYNAAELAVRLRRGQVLFLQRASAERMRAIAHVAASLYHPDAGDCLVRRGNKYRLHRPPPLQPEDVPLPVQPAGPGVVLCFGDRIRRRADRALLDPLALVAWPVLRLGDTVLVTPQDGDWVLVNRQPTLVEVGVC